MLHYDPSAEEVMRDPYPIYKRLRDEAPVYFVEEWNTWALSRFQDIWDVTQDNRNLTAREGTTPPYLVTKTIPALPNLNHMDLPEQKVLRKELAPFFMPQRVRRLEPRIRQIVSDALDSFIESGQADAAVEIGQVVASRVACEAIGFPRTDSSYIVDLVKRFISREEGSDGITETGVSAFDEMQRYLAKVAANRRNHRGASENPIDVLLRAEVCGERLADEIIGQHLILMLVGATETFPKVFTSSIYRLWQHPDQRRELVQRPAGIPLALRECLRYDMPTQFAMRKVVREFEIRGTRLQPGQVLMFLWPSGNRDEREFPDPDRFDIKRAAGRYLSFGNGIHRCLGSHFAEREGRLLLEELLRRAPDYEIDEAGLELEPSEFFHGFRRVPIRC
jgi:cytochrome P450